MMIDVWVNYVKHCQTVFGCEVIFVIQRQRQLFDNSRTLSLLLIMNISYSQVFDSQLSTTLWL